MRNIKEEIDISLSRIMAAKQQLKQVQTEAGQLVIRAVAERGTVKFVPSAMWQARIDAGDEMALEQAVDDEGVGEISYDNDDLTPGSARVLGLRYEEGAVIIDIQDTRTAGRDSISMDDTWDYDVLLEFVRRFGCEERVQSEPETNSGTAS